MATLDVIIHARRDDRLTASTHEFGESGRVCVVNLDAGDKHYFTIQGSPENVVNFLGAALDAELDACAKRWPDDPEPRIADSRRALDHLLATGEAEVAG